MTEDSGFDQAKNVLALRVRQIRRQRGLSQEGLADAAAIHRTYVGMLERQEVNPSLRVLCAIADAFDITLGDLLTVDIK